MSSIEGVVSDYSKKGDLVRFKIGSQMFSGWDKDLNLNDGDLVKFDFTTNTKDNKTYLNFNKGGVTVVQKSPSAGKSESPERQSLIVKQNVLNRATEICSRLEDHKLSQMSTDEYLGEVKRVAKDLFNFMLDRDWETHSV